MPRFWAIFMKEILIITGPTATGKTGFALQLAEKFSGELISADSRQVYIGADIVTGKDIPNGFTKKSSDLVWHDRPLTYYTDGTIRIWLTDVVNLDEQFNVSFWKECCDLIISDILARNKLPVVVGGTGLYIKSLTQNLSQISVPFNRELRESLKNLTRKQLFNYLKNINSLKAESLNESDSHNPRRLIRAIEISEYLTNNPKSYTYTNSYNAIFVGLSSSRDYLSKRITSRVEDRFSQGADWEARYFLSKYPPDLPALTACGYRAFMGNDPKKIWITSETQYLKRQFTWFKKMPDINWFDVGKPDWQNEAEKMVVSWYNKLKC